MKLAERGTSTSRVEISNISSQGIWIYVRGKEHFLSYKDFPWFKDARLSEIQEVRLINDSFLRWECLDVDLALDSIENPGRYPLKYK
ncbi:MAG: DUF2442 domain-containing protein [Candidatus Omnitrophota bacterium]|nr:DUF2442 domain-containing protein [Candidatus Omnitrophota bacterium]